MTGGLFALFVWCGLISLFSILNVSNGVLVCIILFGCTYQLTLGSFQFVYFSQVAGESLNSIATFSLWSSTLIVNTLMPILIANLGAGGTFGVFAVCSVLGGVYTMCFMKDTKGLDKDQLRELFFPSELKSRISDHEN